MPVSGHEATECLQPRLVMRQGAPGGRGARRADAGPPSPCARRSGGLGGQGGGRGRGGRLGGGRRGRLRRGGSGSRAARPGDGGAGTASVAVARRAGAGAGGGTGAAMRGGAAGSGAAGGAGDAATGGAPEGSTPDAGGLAIGTPSIRSSSRATTAERSWDAADIACRIAVWLRRCSPYSRTASTRSPSTTPSATAGSTSPRASSISFGPSRAAAPTIIQTIPNGLSRNLTVLPAHGMTLTRRRWTDDTGTSNGSLVALASPFVCSIPPLISTTRWVTVGG
jgi:hypothetical protein